MTDFEIVIIGSGTSLSGLAFARFYLDIHPQTKLAVLEAGDCLGGVWSSSRSYDEFWTQSGRRMTGFSDVPLTIPSDAPLFYDTFEAKYVTRYLEDYVDTHIYDGVSLRSRILFTHAVQKVEKIEVPNMPSLPNQSEFEGHIFHHKAFGEASRSVLVDPSCNRIAVLGGGKSAVDMVYESVKKGKSVNWVVRKSGEGPALFFPAPRKGRYKNSIESSATRYKACFSPSSFMPNLWLARLFHRTNYGRKYMAKMVEDNDQHCRVLAAYQTRVGALPGFRDLDFTTSAFWFTGPLGLAQHDDFWDTIAQNVHIYRKDIVSMKTRVIILDDGTEIPADALLCAAEAQAIWTTAYLDGSIGLPPLQQAQKEVAYMNAFSRRRYPSHGQKGDCLFFELVWYTDNLLEDVGLKSHRKGLWSDWVEPCLAADFKDIKDEYRNKYGF
ncbi:hypothetical protein G7Y89_g10950 [Cudoniella acicularis]|uniref:Uncharacterized protein n=1 Tax=Cudoniella acicularis TaxID=354080 RepID=A0A8H4RCU9_9HELO|nr:hypothetical protein G7Y89_g10950 [Cudoniella acicularis]